MPFKPTVSTTCPTCGKHFLAPKPASTRPPTKFCSLPCAKESRAVDLTVKFWRSVVKGDSCWLWTAYTTQAGYGQFSHRGKVLYSHRVSWELHRGKIPEGADVLHNCPGGDNPACVNPDHLWLGNQSANIHDMYTKGRGKPNGRPQPKLTHDDIRSIRARVAAGESRQVIAADHKTSIATVGSIFNRKTWAHVTDSP